MTPRKPLPLLTPSIRDLDAVFAAFADRTRLRILNALAGGELCVCDLVDILGLPQPTVSRHLARLRHAGLVEATRDWRFAHYRLVAPPDAVRNSLLGCVAGCFDGIPQLERERGLATARAATRTATPC